MPHSREVRATSHDRHDPILVAALAADDLAADDRDQALELTRSCADCALLHDDLRAIARATAAAPPPITERPRDFRLSPADAARLRPNAWRRLAAAVAGARAGLSRPLGVGLATIGLAGLLIGNVQLPLGSPAAAPEAARTGQGAGAAPSSGRDTTVLTDGASQSTEGNAAGVTGAPAPAASAASAASAAPVFSDPGTLTPVDASAGPRSAFGDGAVPGPTDMSGAIKAATDDPEALLGTALDQPFRPLNLLFGAAIVLGLGLLVASRRRGRPTI